MHDIKIAPSILAADFGNLLDEIKDVERGGADWVHVDVMDGHFVPNITFGAPVLQAVAPHTGLFVDVHLMIENPDQYIADFVQAGAQMITVHAEACIHLHRVIHLIKEHGIKAGVALNPATPVSAIKEVLEDVDMVLVMTVNPGFGGQAFIPRMVNKIREIRETANQMGHTALHIQVDGGIAASTAKQVVEAGADVLVAGSAVFGTPDRAKAIQSIRDSLL